MTEQDVWTLDELIAHVAQALADGYPGAPSGRVRDLPDARTVRWYVTRGLVDPPLGMRGRQAFYGRRHLLQLVALKRRQADGAPLAVIQAELAGLPDASLARVAALPAPAPTPASAPGTPPNGAGTPSDAAAPAPRARFWSAPTVSAPPTAPARTSSPMSAEPPMPAEPPAPESVRGNGALPTLQGIRLAPGVVLLLDADVAATAHPLDDAALRAAAVPLLALLHHNRTEDEGTRR